MRNQAWPAPPLFSSHVPAGPPSPVRWMGRAARCSGQASTTPSSRSSPATTRPAAVCGRAVDVSTFAGVIDSLYLRPMEYKQIRAMAARCPELADDHGYLRLRPGADVVRQVRAGQRGPRRDEVGGRSLEHDPAAVVAGAGA